jgi:hypothetical protein
VAAAGKASLSGSKASHAWHRARRGGEHSQYGVLTMCQWKKEVVVIFCGDSQRDLVRQVTAKVDALKPTGLFQEQSIVLVLRGFAAPRKEEKSFLAVVFE